LERVRAAVAVPASVSPYPPEKAPPPPPRDCALRALGAEYRARAPAAGAAIAVDHLSWLVASAAQVATAAPFYWNDCAEEFAELRPLPLEGYGGGGGGAIARAAADFSTMAPLFAAAAVRREGAQAALRRLSDALNDAHARYDLPPPALTEKLPPELLSLFAEHAGVWDVAEAEGVRFLGPGYNREHAERLLQAE
jgi:hypothetical protein